MKALEILLNEKMMTLVRAKSQNEGQALADALVASGVKVIEITLTTPGALKIIANLLEHKGLLVGAGTVRTVKDVKKVEDVGAKFIVSPDTNEDVIAATKKLKLVSMP
ncbi:MAG: bifunctional 4-hydroxy-2-oxoglutarate aldolase/2-dehydro-3-deoxy-phosphogluconate aldolase, partial [Candidatus Nanopelagicus sp.]